MSDSDDMMQDDLEGGWDAMESVSPMDVLVDLNSPENIEMKTEIHNVPGMAGLKFLANYLNTIDFMLCAEDLDKYIDTHFKYMVSYKRQGRAETIGAVSNQRNPDLSPRERMLTDLKES